jgi:hypothetical protein
MHFKWGLIRVLELVRFMVYLEGYVRLQFTELKSIVRQGSGWNGAERILGMMGNIHSLSRP